MKCIGGWDDLSAASLVIEIASVGFMSAVAAHLYVVQPSLSKAVAELEAEMGTTIFERSQRSVTLTEEGTRFLSYARQVVELVDLLERQYQPGAKLLCRVFAVSAQHYAFVVNTFVVLVKEY